MPSLMLQRFEGAAGRQALVKALLLQPLVHGNPELAAELAGIAEIAAYDAGATVMLQGESDTEIYLVLAGRVSIQINGREVVQRGPGEHVGEMALIDPRARRSASVFAMEEAVLARVPEPAFSALADRYPELWRILARELGNRLRQRDRLMPHRNSAPRLLIAASTEALVTARHIQSKLADRAIVAKIWTGSVFGKEGFVFDALQSLLEQIDFALLVLEERDVAPDQDAGSSSVLRDDVIFELGLFIGMFGRERVLLVMAEGTESRIPLELTAAAPLVVGSGDPADLSARLDPVCFSLCQFIAARGPR
jgi:predicted nucleotide-binding protein